MPISRSRSLITVSFFLAFLIIGTACSSGGKKTSQTSDQEKGMALRPEEASAHLPSLQAQLDKRKANFTAHAPAEIVTAFENGVEQLQESGIVQQAKNVGDTAPDFTLPDAKGGTVSLSKILADGPAVIVWYRGGWCPYCNAQLRAMQQALPEIKSAGGQLVAISPNLPDSSLSTQERDSLQFYVLSDHDNAVARQYGIVYTVPDTVLHYFKGRVDLAAYSGVDSNELPLAVTYVVGRDGVIKWAFVSADYRRRAEPADVVAALRKLRQS